MFCFACPIPHRLCPLIMSHDLSILADTPMESGDIVPATPDPAPKVEPEIIVIDSDEEGTDSDPESEEPEGDGDEPEEKGVDEEGLPPVAADKGKFRLQAQQLLLTYSQTGPNGKDDVYGALVVKLSKLGLGVSRAVYADEFHKDGGRHVHVLLRLSKRPNVRDARFADVTLGAEVFHPNIRVIRGKKDNEIRAMSYVMKQGDYTDTGYKEVHLRMWTGFKRRIDDFRAYEDFCRGRNVAPLQAEVRLPGDVQVVLHRGSERVRHLLLVGPPGSGKSTWFDRVFDSRSVFDCSRDTKGRYEHYCGQPVILFDDCYPTFDELVTLTNVRPRRVKCPGFTRYQATYFEPNSSRTVVILANKIPSYGPHQEAFATRFRCYYLGGRYPDGISWVKAISDREVLDSGQAFPSLQLSFVEAPCSQEVDALRGVARSMSETVTLINK